MSNSWRSVLLQEKWGHWGEQMFGTISMLA